MCSEDRSGLFTVVIQGTPTLNDLNSDNYNHITILLHLTIQACKLLLYVKLKLLFLVVIIKLNQSAVGIKTYTTLLVLKGM
jgi:hypothetical protein